MWAEQEVDADGKPVIKSADPITLVELLTSPSNSRSPPFVLQHAVV